jgi:hypothetical protein
VKNNKVIFRFSFELKKLTKKNGLNDLFSLKKICFLSSGFLFGSAQQIGFNHWKQNCIEYKIFLKYAAEIKLLYQSVSLLKRVSRFKFLRIN